AEPGNPAHAIFERFLRAGECREVLGCFLELCQQLGLQGSGLQLYHGLKAALNYWNAKALWSKLDKKAGHKDYDQGTACAGTKCLVVGAGPCGLRAAIELALLGARVVLLEKRDSFSRNNVLHLWPFTIHDLRALGAKKFYGRFCTGTLDHISIRQLQLILLKVALLLGVEVHINVRFEGLVPPTDKAGGWHAVLQPSSSPLTHYEFDVLISAGGGKFVPEGFKRKETRGKLAIGITTNFINRHSRAEVEVAEISGVARIYNQKFFQNLYNKTGIDLENIVYYKDDTHYFVMTAKKQSLLKKGVILQDKADIESLLAPDNVNRDALLSYAKEAANFSTNYCLPDLEFALNHRDLPDVDMFDFTCMTRSENAALVQEHNGSRVLLGLVGDCLVEPFWPLGTGVARGFLAAFDAAWMVRRWAAGTPPLEVLAERESIYQRLSQTSPDNTNKNVSQYSIDPATRYPNINLQAIKASQVDLGGVSPVSASPVASGAVCEELLSWCQASTAGYPGVAVTNFSTSWTSGLALCALIHRFPMSLHRDFDSIDPQDAIQTHQMLLDIAEQELGIQPVLSSAEMATLTEPDCLDLITYLSHFYQIFGTSPEVEVSKKPLSPPGTRGAILFLSKLQKSRNLAHKRSQAPGASPACPVPPQPPRDRTGENSDACYFCGRRVYIVERASAEGRFFHRGCFQCRRCGATLRLGDYAFDEEDGNFYCSLHYPNPASMDLPREEASALPDGVNHPKSLWVPRAELQGAAEEGEETGGRRKIILTPLEKLSLSTLNLTSEAEPESPLKPARLRLQAAPGALPALRQGQGAWKEEEEEEKIDMEKGRQEVPGAGTDPPARATILSQYPEPREEEKYPSWKRTLARRTRESQMKRFCRAQAIQRRLEEIEVTFRELEQQGIKLEKLLRDENESVADQQTQWTNQLLYLVQKKNNLMTEESDLMIAVQELKLEEQQCQLDEKLRSYMNKEDALKTPEDEKAEQEILKQLVEVVNKRNILIQLQEEKRLSELRA
uniref:Molecule interacting with CasL protein 1 n=1 Tax=Serinus canaria TaxID=9135 RepID=A0A8C9NR74_SERCA